MYFWEKEDKIITDFSTFAGYIGALVTIISICLNIIQYIKKADDRKALRSQMQSEYNFHFLVARACTRVRALMENANATVDDKIHGIFSQVSIIQGVADTARNAIIAYSREHLDYLPYYEHPAYPGKEVDDQVRFGLPPEKLINKGNGE